MKLNTEVFKLLYPIVRCIIPVQYISYTIEQGRELSENTLIVLVKQFKSTRNMLKDFLYLYETHFQSCILTSNLKNMH